jgi:hypothetical protein
MRLSSRKHHNMCRTIVFMGGTILGTLLGKHSDFFLSTISILAAGFTFYIASQVTLQPKPVSKNNQ